MIPATDLSRRFLLTTPFAGFVRGASLATAGLLIATGVALIAPDIATVAPWQLVVGAAAAVLTYQGRIHPGVVVIGGAFAGVVLAR